MSELDPHGDVEAQLPSEARLAIQQLCASFERELKAQATPRIEDFLKDSSGELRSFALRQLLIVELRASTVDAAIIEQYNQRFPGDAAVVAAAVERAQRSKSQEGLGQSTNSLSAETVDVRRRAQGPVDDEQPMPAELGRYEIRQVLGRGAFGCV